MEEILYQLIGSLSHFLRLFPHPRWLAGFLPSTVLQAKYFCKKAVSFHWRAPLFFVVEGVFGKAPFLRITELFGLSQRVEVSAAWMAIFPRLNGPSKGFGVELFWDHWDKFVVICWSGDTHFTYAARYISPFLPGDNRICILINATECHKSCCYRSFDVSMEKGKHRGHGGASDLFIACRFFWGKMFFHV